MKIKTFYSYFRSSTAYRLRIALNLKGVQPQEVKYINLREGEQRSAEYMAVNPMGALPALVLEDGTVLTQSMALLEWLEEACPEPALLPKDSVLRARVRAFCHIISSDIHPVNNLRVLNYLSTEFGADEAAKKQWIHHWTHQAFPALEKMVADAKEITMADICLIPQWYNAERFGVDLAAYPQLAHRVAHCRTLPAFDLARPENQPDFS
jgi:maleylpyruvate isomerase